MLVFFLQKKIWKFVKKTNIFFDEIFDHIPGKFSIFSSLVEDYSFTVLAVPHRASMLPSRMLTCTTHIASETVQFAHVFPNIADLPQFSPHAWNTKWQPSAISFSKLYGISLTIWMWILSCFVLYFVSPWERPGRQCIFQMKMLINTYNVAGESRRQDQNVTFFVKNVNILEFGYYIWNPCEKCIQKSPNVPGIG